MHISIKPFFFAGLVALAPVTATAAVVTVDIAGTFSAGFNGNPLNPGFPNPDLANGSFAGSFTYDDAAAPFNVTPTVNNFDVLSNNVELRTPANALDYTITIDGNNALRLINSGVSDRLIIFLGDSTTTFPDDLRLHFDVTGLGLVADGSPLTAAEFALAITSGTFLPDPNSLLDVEGVPSDFTLGVASARVTIVDIADIAEPGTLALLGLGLTALMVAARRRPRDSQIHPS